MTKAIEGARRPFSILFTNLVLTGRSGTETLTRDIVVALRRRGHSVTLFAPKVGRMAAQVRALGVPVVTTLGDLKETPDIIHGQHTGPTVAALARFPGVPAVFVCHDFSSAMEDPPVHPRIRRYLHVRSVLRGRLAAEAGIEPARIGFWPNTVDLARVGPAREPGRAPQRAAIFAHAGSIGFAPVLRAACEARGIAFAGDLLAGPTDNAVARLADVDIVFASGRMAIEAAAAGCAVINADRFGVAGLVTTDRLEASIATNFAVGALSDAPTPKTVDAALAAYDADDAMAVTRHVRARLDSDSGAALIEAEYRAVLAERPWKASPPSEDDRAMARLIEKFLQENRLYNPDFIRLREGGETMQAMQQSMAQLTNATMLLSREVERLRRRGLWRALGQRARALLRGISGN